MKIFDAIQQITPCPKTKSTGCQCDKLEGITEAEQTIQAIVELEHIVGDIEGFVKLKQKANGPTIIKGILKGLEPGKHGFHIHEFGDLSDGCKSAGGHYNPEGVDHGDLNQGHVGDLGNIVADQSGTARFQIKAERVELSDVVGRAIVIHADEDDLGKGGDEESLKTGNAGDRLACGVIRLREVVEENYNRTVSNKHFDRNQLPQINRIDIQTNYSTDEYKEGKVSLSKLKPVQSQRVHGYDKKAEQVFLNDIDKPFIIDKNGYIINGHHRYDAANMLGIKRVKAIKIEQDIEDVINKFSHKSSNVEVMDENYFKKLLQEKMLEGDVVSGNFGGQADVPQLPHQEVLMAISSWEYGDTPIYLSNGYVVNAYEEGASADDNAWIVLDPQGKEYDRGTGSIEDVMQEFTPELIDENVVSEGVKETFAKLKQALSTEQGETKQMMDVYKRALKNQASPVEINTANKQFKDILRILGLTTFIAGTSMIPGSGPALFPIEKYLNTKGISILPNGFKDAFPQALPKSLHKVGDKVTLDGATYDVQKVDANTGTVDVKDQSGKVWTKVKSTTFFKQVPEVAEATSSPGRVKRAGASCKGSATELRKKAKKYSGEKGKMYHWCANMKGGKKKS